MAVSNTQSFRQEKENLGMVGFSQMGNQYEKTTGSP